MVLFRSDYTDRYYKPFPAGDRFIAAALRKEAPGWPAPTPETMTYLADCGVMTLGLDGASMGPLPTLAAATHQAGGRRGMIWTECATNLGALPATGAFYVNLAAPHAGGSGGECRNIAITDPALTPRLIDAARHKRVVDLSVTLEEDYPVTWPGYGPGDEASRYVAKTLNAFAPARGPYFARTHLLDGLAGTHVVIPAFSLPPPDFDEQQYSVEVRQALKTFEARYGRRGRSAATLEQVSLADLMGEAHIIDVRDLAGTTTAESWPASPAITLDMVKRHESQVRPVRAGEVVVFYSGYSDRYFQPLPPAPELDRLFAAPLAGKAEGWPAPTPEVVAYLAEKGVKCIGGDGPTLAGVDRVQSLFVNWLAATRQVYLVEYLTNIGAIAGKKAFFIFAPVKIRGTRGGYGRALALYD